jgi:hypothetical protein
MPRSHSSTKPSVNVFTRLRAQTITTGLVPGSGSGTANAAMNATGSVALTGAVTVQNGRALSPGNPFGSLTLGNNLTLAAGSTTFMQVQHSPLANNAVNISGTFIAGGTLVVTNSGAPLAKSATFKLFSAGNDTGGFSQLILPTLLGDLLWNTNALSRSSTISVIALIPPIISIFDKYTLLLPKINGQ